MSQRYFDHIYAFLYSFEKLNDVSNFNLTINTVLSTLPDTQEAFDTYPDSRVWVPKQLYSKLVSELIVPSFG